MRRAHSQQLLITPPHQPNKDEMKTEEQQNVINFYREYFKRNGIPDPFNSSPEQKKPLRDTVAATGQIRDGLKINGYEPAKLFLEQTNFKKMFIHGYSCAVAMAVSKMGVSTLTDELFKEGVGSIQVMIDAGCDQSDIDILKEHYK